MAAPHNQHKKEKKKEKVQIKDSPQQRRRLKDLKVPELKSLLQDKALPVAGKKDELIERLRKYPNGYGPKGAPKQWQYSNTKMKLKKDLLDKNSHIHDMSVNEIWNSNPLYKQYPLFPKYYEDLKKQVEAEGKEAHLDDIKAEKHIKNNPRGTLNKRGYPHWDKHPAKKLLQVDVYRKLHEAMRPCELQKTRKEYKEFPPEIFAARVNSEVLKQKAAKFWAYKRNKEGMKKYLKEIYERAHM
jgi:hypothetical protein